MKLRRLLFLGSVCLFSVICVQGLGFGAEKVRGVTSDSIRIGVSAPLTKFMGNSGRQSVAAITAYTNYINDMGGINGRKIVLVIDDSQVDPSISLGIFKKQVYSDNVFALFSWGTPPTGVLIKPAMEAKIPLLIEGAAKSFYLPPKKYVFCFMPPYELQTATCVSYIHDVLKKERAKIAIFWRNDDYGKTGLLGGEVAAKYYKYEVVAKPSYIFGQAIDFTSEVMAIKRADADFVLLSSAAGDVASFLREAKNQRLRAVNIGVLAPCSERQIIFQAGDAAKDYISIQTISMFKETEIPGVSKMLEIARKYTPKEILAEESFYYTYANYIFMTIYEGLRRAGADLTQENFVTRGLETIQNYSGDGLGPASSFTSGKHYSAEASFLGKVNMDTKNFDRITGWLTPPQTLINEIFK